VLPGLGWVPAVEASSVKHRFGSPWAARGRNIVCDIANHGHRDSSKEICTVYGVRCVAAEYVKRPVALHVMVASLRTAAYISMGSISRAPATEQLVLPQSMKTYFTLVQLRSVS
jgi:hypothetical protein